MHKFYSVQRCISQAEDTCGKFDFETLSLHQREVSFMTFRLMGNILPRLLGENLFFGLFYIFDHFFLLPKVINIFLFSR